jgi:hypothetical protein
MVVLTKYDHIEAIYLRQSVVTYIYLHPVYACVCSCVRACWIGNRNMSDAYNDDIQQLI